MLGRTLVGVWIKITRTTIVTSMPIIASFADAWIKIFKFEMKTRAGAWIKMDPSDFRIGQEKKVAPFMVRGLKRYDIYTQNELCV